MLLLGDWSRRSGAEKECNRMIRSTILVLAILALSVSADPDGSESGSRLCLGLGFGPSLTSYTQELDPSSGSQIEEKRETALGFGTDLYIGGGINGTTFLTGYLKINWFTFKNRFQEYFAANSNTGIQLTKFLSSQDGHAPFLLFGFGWSGLTDMARRDESTTPGIAPTVGFGFKIHRNYGFQSTLFYNNPSPLNTDNGYGVKVSALSLQLNYFVQI